MGDPGMSTSQSVLVTGSNSGFGLLIVKTLAAAGYKVAAAMRGVDGKNAAAAQDLQNWAKENNATVQVVELDVTSEESIDKGVADAVSKLGGLDVVVNNAGLGTVGISETFTAAQMQSVFDVNDLGVHRVNRAVLPELRKRGNGLIIHISSGLGRFIMPAMGVYVASKFALEALAETYHYELAGQGIDAVIVQPGAFGTDFGAKAVWGQDTDRAAGYGGLAQLPAQMGQNMQAMFSAPDAPKPQEVADAVLNLVKTPHGKRPLRTVVDRVGGAAVEAINKTVAQVTSSIFDAWHLTAALKPQS
jgi:NAD(P)-dependent dehydrogenase (short-subunit alcohol dehydrogenase family)